MRGRALIAAIAATLALAVPAQARVREAGSVLPPGQSGFVTTAGLADGTGSPHLTDQLPLFLSFHFKNAMFGQPGNGIVETPRAGVTITRDAYGVPTINGDSDYNLWYGAAYAVAEDRLFQLDLFRRATQGRLAEILGKDYLDDDLIARRDYYTPAEIDQQIAALPASLRARFDAYRDGINAYIAQTRIDPTQAARRVQRHRRPADPRLDRRGLGRHRRAARPHRPVRRRRRARQRARPPGHRPEVRSTSSCRSACPTRS